MSEAAGTVAARVKDALRLVIDPELGYNIVDLGLIYEVEVPNGRDVQITMTTTTRGCPATDYLQTGARDAAFTVEGIGSAQVTMTYEPAWSPRMMSPEAKAHFRIRED